jgi:Ca-activated chloride channel family protein
VTNVCSKILLSLLVLAALLASAKPGAPGPQTPNADESSGAPPISDNVNLVVLHPTVRNRKGEFISGLKQTNFQVLENGAAQKITFFSHQDMPVAAGLIVDSSGSMGPKRAAVTAGAEEFARRSNPGDQIFVLDFNEHIYSGMPGAEMFSAKPADLEQAILAAPPSGRTALYDAIAAGYERLQHSKLDKQVLLVITDGGDNASHLTFETVLKRAERSNVIVYAIGIYDENDPDRDPGVLKRIARATGGAAYFPGEISEVQAVCGGIATDIRNQYTIAYSPSDQEMDGKYHAIRVQATGPTGHKLLVRARAGYIAAPAGATR